MTQQPDERFWTSASVHYLADRLDLPVNSQMQDWAFEVADPAHLARYLALFDEISGDPDLRFTLADIIIQAFESSDRTLETDPDWGHFLAALSADVETHAYQIWYWSASDCGPQDAWRVSPAMRLLAVPAP